MMNKIKLSLEEKKRNQKDKRLRATYGISIEEWEEKSKNGCEVCGKKDGILCQDHIHIKGFKGFTVREKAKYLRGCVCFYCNTGFKGFERTKDGNRNRKQLQGTYEYFQKYKLKGE